MERTERIVDKTIEVCWSVINLLAISMNTSQSVLQLQSLRGLPGTELQEDLPQSYQRSK